MLNLRAGNRLVNKSASICALVGLFSETEIDKQKNKYVSQVVSNAMQKKKKKKKQGKGTDNTGKGTILSPVVREVSLMK